MRGVRARLPAALVPGAVTALLVSSCTVLGNDQDDADAPGISGIGNEAAESAPDEGNALDTESTTAAVFVEQRCEFELPARTNPRCGTVTVPMDWATGTGQVSLAVAVFESTAADPAADPVVYLEGGPGGHALETSRFVAADLIDPLLERGDVVFFDQRGAGLSAPRLDCFEIRELDRELEDSPDLDRSEVERRSLAAIAACGSRFQAEGIDLAAFNSINNAHDVEAIRVALGYDRWNLLGVSYGTRLGLEVLRQHPDGVRSAVLDSVLPPQADRALENPSTFLASYDAVVAACAAEASCAAGGDLGSRIESLARRYEADPAEVEVRDYLAGTSDRVRLEGDAIVDLVTQALYTPYWFTDLPELVTELEAGELEAASEFLSRQRTNEPFVSVGMFYAIECNEEIAFSDPADVAAAVPADPFGLQDRFEYASNLGTNAFDTCAAFGFTEAPPSSIEPVISDVPALLMAGRFDPVTPVAWAEQAAETLDNSFLVVAPHASHGVSPGRCGMDVVRQFLDAPDREPNSECFNDEPFSFLGAPRAVNLETFSYDSAVGAVVSGLRPQDWDGGDLLGDSYRQESLLDPTLLFQLTGNLSLNEVVVDYLSNVFGIQLGTSVRVPGPRGRGWDHRQGRSERAAAEIYRTTMAGFPVVVMLVSGPAELDHNIETVLLPALQAIEVEPVP